MPTMARSSWPSTGRWSIGRRLHGRRGRWPRRRRATVDEVDQWTVGDLRSRLPLIKYSWPDGQQVYVDGSTAEVVQYTTIVDALLGLSRRHPALALLHAPPEARAAMVLVCRVVVDDRHRVGADRRGDRRLDVFAAEALPACGRADQHSLQGLEALAHHLRTDLRRRHHDVGVQRVAVDGAVPDCRSPDGPDGARGAAAGTGRQWQCRRARRPRRRDEEGTSPPPCAAGGGLRSRRTPTSTRGAAHRVGARLRA